VAQRAGRTLVIGLELGDGRLIEKWAHAGHLPTLARLRSAGTFGRLESIAGLLHVAVWPSIYTGTSPGQHGVYFTFQPAPGLQGYQRFHQGLYGRPTFWGLLGAAGARCTVLDAPYTQLEEGFSGCQVVDWGTWAHYLGPTSTPAALLPELRRACGDYPLGLEANDIGFMPISADNMHRRLVGAVRAKAEAARWLMRQREWDLFFTVFDETHPAAHYCWSPADAADGGGASRLREIYREIDQGIGALVEEAGPGASVFVISGDAVGPNRTNWYLLPEILGRLGVFASADATPPQTGSSEQPGRARRDPIKVIRDLLPQDLRKALARRLPTRLRDSLARRVDTAAIDWSRTRAYCLPTDLEGCIRINLAGREPAGVVQPGAEYEALCNELAAALAELVEPASARPVVRQVLRADQAFAGPRRPCLPDLVVVWAPEAATGEVASPRIGTVALPSPDPRPGTHTDPGFLLACGPEIAAGGALEGGDILDIAPTILARHGVGRPEHMEGRVLPQLAMA
jgi:predicted AlkP superfamily phosphohydrolase/phosphomutase